MKKLFAYVALMLHCMWCFAQKDTLYLEELSIEDGRLSVLDIGSSNQHLSSALFQNYSGKNLSDLLQENTGIYVRKYGGEGQLSSIAFRGTTPNHTLITWNGIDINAQTLGQSDLASIPAYLFESAEVLAGGASTLFGGGNIGGSINLKQPSQKEGAGFSFDQEIGSFGRFFSGVKSHFGNKKVMVNMSAFRNKIDNDFLVNYRNDTYRQNNAQSILQGLQTDLSYKINKRNTLNTQLWYNHHDRQLQPTIGDLTNDDHLLDRNLRLLVGHQWNSKSAILKSSFFHIRDFQTYNHASETNLTRNIAKVDFEYFQIDKVILSGGLVGQLAHTDVDNFTTDTSQWKVENYVLAQVNPLPKLKLSMRAQKSYIEGLEVPFVFGGGAELSVVKQQKTELITGVNVSESFRAPTLNDLFWSPGGNPELKPERGFHSELFFKLTRQEKQQTFRVTTNLYQTKIKNMIQWLPMSSASDQAIWSPENVRSVRIRGLEQVISYRYAGRLTFRAEATYSFNQSTNLSAIAGNDLTIDKQLAYVPFHKLASNASVAFSGWAVNMNYSYTSRRYTEASNRLYVEGFGLFNTILSKSLSTKSSQFNLSIKIENILNNDYQNYELRATPGRSYILKLNYKISNIYSE
ncbi:MAG: TonB-dependent receptor plug domain-containing protein [Cyclobacteriaceae bacterium]